MKELKYSTAGIDQEILDRALLLRRISPSKMTYPAIAIVMGEYHGVWKSPVWWRGVLRTRGADPRKPRTSGFKCKV